MTTRNDLESAHARIESLERETRALADQNALLSARLDAPTPKEATPLTSVVVETPHLIDTETSDDTNATWMVTLGVTILSLGIAAAIMFGGNT